MPLCPSCHQEVAGDDAFCRHCGTALKESKAAGDRQRVAFMEEMAARFERRLKEKATDTDAMYNLALTYFYAERYSEALPLFEQVVSALPDFIDARVKWAIALWHTGQQQEALAQIQEAALREPDNEKVRRLKRRMEHELQ